MRRKITLGMGVAAAFAIFFLVPLVPVGIIHIRTVNCPSPTQICDLGGNGIFEHGLGSMGSRSIGYGGAWNYQLNRYEMGGFCNTYSGQGVSSVICTQVVPDRQFA